MNVGAVEEFRELYRLYDEGLYTRHEIVSKAIELLGHGNQSLWEILPEDIRAEVESVALSFSEEDEIVYFGSEDPCTAKRRLMSLKRWLAGRQHQS